MSNEICVLTVVLGKVKRREDLRVSIRASVVASKVLYVQHVKENRRTLTLAKYTYEIGGRLHSAMRTIGTPLAHECRALYFSAFGAAILFMSGERFIGFYPQYCMLV